MSLPQQAIPPDQITRLRNAERVALIGVGSELRGDDAAGMTFVSLIDARRPRLRGWRCFYGGAAPENLTGEIARYLRGAHAGKREAIFVDAADLGLPAGHFSWLSLNAISGETFSSHRLPLAMIGRYLSERARCQVDILAIQPATLAYGASLSPEVEDNICMLADILGSVLFRPNSTVASGG